MQFWNQLKLEVKKEIHSSGLLMAIFDEIEFQSLTEKPELNEIQLGIGNLISKEIAQREINPIIIRQLKNIMNGQFVIQYQTTESPSQLQLNLENDVENQQSVERPLSFEFKPAWLMNPQFKLSQFVCCENSEFAYKCIEFMTTIVDTNIRQLFIHGPSGVGKTHLLHAFGWKFKDQNKAINVKVISAEEFINDFHLFLSKKQMSEFRGKYRLQTDVLLIDDVHIFSKTKSAQEELFNILNYYENNKKYIAFTSDTSPHDLIGFEERVLSRLQGGLSAKIHLPNKDARIKIANHKKIQFGYNIKDEIIQVVAERINQNVRSLEGVIHLIGNYQLAKKRLITCKELSELLPSVAVNFKKNNVEEILNEVAEEYLLKVSDLKSENRKVVIVSARRKAMFRLRSELNYSFSEIGRIFGKDHSTVMSAINKYQASIKIQ